MTKIVVVTGASGGIGGAVVDAAARRGHGVLALARSHETLEGLRESHPEATPVLLDLGRPLELPPALANLERLDALVHCAGIAEVASVEDTPYELWLETLTVNVIGVAELTRALLPALRAAEGRVVFVNAAPGLHAVPNWAAYTASKAALTELAGSLREEEDKHGVRVTSIYPAGVATELLRKVRQQFGRPYDPSTSVRPETLAWLVTTALEFPDDAHLLDVSIRPAPTGH